MVPEAFTEARASARQAPCKGVPGKPPARGACLATRKGPGHPQATRPQPTHPQTRPPRASRRPGQATHSPATHSPPTDQATRVPAAGQATHRPPTRGQATRKGPGHPQGARPPARGQATRKGPGHPQGVALLYTTAPPAAQPLSRRAGPPPDAVTSGRPRPAA